MSKLRQIAKDNIDLDQRDLAKLVKSKFHEERMTALLILLMKYKITTKQAQKNVIFRFYVKNLMYINAWDLVDTSCPGIVGAHLQNSNKVILKTWAQSHNLWTRRISIVSTLYFIRQKQLDETYALARILLTDHEDLIHKAVGWMLREAGKVDPTKLLSFLDSHHEVMPRTMLRYSLEKFNKHTRGKYLRSLPKR